MYLNCHSYFSLRYGTLKIEELIEEAKDKTVDTLVLADINNTSGWYDFIKACKENCIKPIVGIDFRNKGKHEFTAIAKNKQGLYEISKLLSHYLHIKQPLPAVAPRLSNAVVIYPFCKAAVLTEFQENEYIGIRANEVRKLRLHPLEKQQEKLLLFHPVTFKNKVGFNLHRLLRAIDKSTLLSKVLPDDTAQENEKMLSTDELLKPYSAYPRIISTTLKVLEECSLDEIDLHQPKNRKTFTGNNKDDRSLLSKLANDGFRNRYRNNKVALERMKKELRVIDDLNFSAYFLITWDIVRYAHSRGFRHVGRGSGANSIVAYCLGLTDVDPIELDLYFERFINPYRTSPPDFDIDFCWNERDEVIDYIFKRYGTDHTALLATYSTFRGRSVIRELGKVLGLPKSEIDQLVYSRNNPQHPDKITRLIYKYGEMMQDFPNYLSIHAGGILITEEPINQYTATDLPPKGFATTQFDMFVAEEWGFYKYDILSQRGLGHIKDAVELIRENKGISINIEETEKFKKDERLNNLLRTGDTIGCFYIESPAMRQLLLKLNCNNYLTLVAASSIIRPGVASSGMMKAYIERHHRPNSFEYIHPKMKELLAETYGVMVYQEDVIKVAHHFAGLDLGQADVLRRAMSGKYRSVDGFAMMKDTYFKNCDERGYAREVSAEVWRQMESFGGYSFSKAHSASFAVESYQSLFLKAYYPLEFITAVINNFGGFYSTEYYLNEAKRLGAKLHEPCLNTSNQSTRLIEDSIYLGFIHLQNLEEQVSLKIVEERNINGSYLSLENFCSRIAISFDQARILIKAGALRFTGKSKKQLYWEANMLLNKRPEMIGAGSSTLFDTEIKSWELPELTDTFLDDAWDQLELMGFTICNPFMLLNHLSDGTLKANDLGQYLNRQVKMVGYLVTTKDVQTVHRDLMQFATFIDADGETFDSIHFPQSLRKYPLSGRGFYLLKGKVIEEFGVFNIEVSTAERLEIKGDARFKT